MNPIFFTFPGSETFCAPLFAQLNSILLCDSGELQIHDSVSDECNPRFITSVAGRDVILGITLNDPDSKIITAYLSACVARELGAKSVGFFIPYLPYSKIRGQCKDYEGDTARHFASLMSGCCDWILTIKPHLQQHHAMSELYRSKTRIVDVVPEISGWIASNVTRPIILALNTECAKWIAQIAEAADCSHTVLNTTYYDDGNVEVLIPDSSFWIGMTPVLIEDVVSSAQTMIAAVRQIELAGMAPPVCIAVHPLFTDEAYKILQASKVDRIVSCNSINHTTNKIDLCRPFAQAIAEIMTTVNPT